jgi:anti-sigma B factor antagonist
MSGFEIEVRRDPTGPFVLSMAGRLNAVSAQRAKDEIKALAGQDGPRLVVDLSGLDFIDSSGLAALVSGFKAASERGGSLRLCGLGRQVASVFALTRLDRVFEIFPGLEEALASFATRE